ncbi:DUF3558 family protein [Prauserella cavernicola]|uniref:DUF3558 family protein n=1 Tax=Prauserella cavernicola TaxID=2800127 RepID=A0A934QQK5_9PSEU|nr:DUF3558 family protein [Prauserella cavernicola]MBK1784382.1 DUF3558 family protein [Prauserella cavernicola]
MRANALVLLAAGVLLSACATPVGGTAQPLENPPTSEDVAASGEPCALLTPEDASALELVEQGEFTPGTPSQLMPPSCTFAQADDMSDLDSLTVAFESTFPLVDYVSGEQPVETKQFGGLDWEHYADPLTGGSVCLLAHELSDTSFVVLSSSDFSSEEAACEVAEAAAPYVSSHLPGGQPAPEPEPEPEPSALADLDPCTLLKPEQAEQIGFSGATTPLEEMPEYGTPPGCQWPDTDGEKGVKALDLYSGDRPAQEWPYADGEGEQVDVDGRTWTLFPAPADLEVNCQATLSFTENSSVYLASGNLDDPAKACDKLREVIPLVTGNLPES